jgi:hypothetical protein
MDTEVLRMILVTNDAASLSLDMKHKHGLEDKSLSLKVFWEYIYKKSPQEHLKYLSCTL